MARFVTGGTSVTVVPSATLPAGTLYGAAARQLTVVELAVFNTTTTAVIVGLCRTTTAGTVGAATTIGKLDIADLQTPTGVGYLNHQSGGPTLTGLPYTALLGAAVGAAYCFTFGGKGLVIPAVANNGLGIYIPEGTGQHLRWYAVWDE